MAKRCIWSKKAGSLVSGNRRFAIRKQKGGGFYAVDLDTYNEAHAKTLAAAKKWARAKGAC